MIDPPADKLYAVEPVGVEIMRPSPTSVVIKLLSNQISSYTEVGHGPLSITISFKI